MTEEEAKLLATTAIATAVFMARPSSLRCINATALKMSESEDKNLGDCYRFQRLRCRFQVGVAYRIQCKRGKLLARAKEKASMLGTG
jgi:hypothetical protein